MPLSPSLVGTRSTGHARILTDDDVAASRELPLMGAIALGLPALGALLVDPALSLSMMRLAGVAHRVALHAPLRAGDIVTTTATLSAIRPDELGEVLDIRLETRGAGGDTVVNATASLLLRGPRRRDGVVVAPAAEVFGPGGDTVVVEVDAARGAALAAGLGDHNPIYVDDDAAAQAGLPGRLVPNLGVLALAGATVDASGRTLRGRFVRPALVGDTLTITHWPVDGGRGFSVVNQEGVVIVVDGTVGGVA
jgi:acyl dehydratase